jgi:hypothetical protein
MITPVRLNHGDDIPEAIVYASTTELPDPAAVLRAALRHPPAAAAAPDDSLAAGYRNSPEMRLTEPATMTTPNT